MRINLKVLASVFILIFLTTIQKSFAQQKGEIFFVVEQMPTFPGGEQALQNFINNAIVYPQEAIQKREEGKFYVKFAVLETGKVEEVSIVKAINGNSLALENEAIRLFDAAIEEGRDATEVKWGQEY